MEKRPNTGKRYKKGFKKKTPVKRDRAIKTRGKGVIKMNIIPSLIITHMQDYHCWLIFNILKSTITNVHGYFQRVVQNVPVPRVEMLYRRTLNTRGQDRSVAIIMT